ncbi:protein kinase family protein [Paenibacillus tritici]|uniref:Protein kinase family protein n=1 Tax=Paenibacillus tritici TaxID=1873425 RepID=A0ABX2DYG0_9BACL|nr:protein kinase family protein [Paenibacillus tritici]NQX48441.1 protein kinase family protein [Paenibacillus tritici]
MVLERWRGFIRAWRDYPLPGGAVIGGRYKIDLLLGEGSYGLTYRCYDTRDGALLALKQSRPSKQALGRTMLAKESAILQAMDHPNIPKCRDYFNYKGSNWLVTDYITGQTLEDLIFDEHVIYGERECLAMALRLMNMVTHVHSRGYVHLDLRIPNVILHKEDLYLIDFGLAEKIGETDTVLERLKPRKQSWPERRPPVIGSDLYDVGQLMLFMLYSGYQPERGGPERSWQEELELSPGMLLLLTRLLGEQECYPDSASFVREAGELYEQLMS